MPREDYGNFGKRRTWSPPDETNVTVDGTVLHYPAATAPQQPYSGGVRRQAARVKRGQTAPRFDKDQPTRAPKKAKESK